MPRNCTRVTGRSGSNLGERRGCGNNLSALPSTLQRRTLERLERCIAEARSGPLALLLKSLVHVFGCVDELAICHLSFCQSGRVSLPRVQDGVLSLAELLPEPARLLLEDSPALSVTCTPKHFLSRVLVAHRLPLFFCAAEGQEHETDLRRSGGQHQFGRRRRSCFNRRSTRLQAGQSTG